MQPSSLSSTISFHSSTDKTSSSLSSPSSIASPLPRCEAMASSIAYGISTNESDTVIPLKIKLLSDDDYKHTKQSRNEIINEKQIDSLQSIESIGANYLPSSSCNVVTSIGPHENEIKETNDEILTTNNEHSEKNEKTNNVQSVDIDNFNGNESILSLESIKDSNIDEKPCDIYQFNADDNIFPSNDDVKSYPANSNHKNSNANDSFLDEHLDKEMNANDENANIKADATRLPLIGVNGNAPAYSFLE